MQLSAKNQLQYSCGIGAQTQPFTVARILNSLLPFTIGIFLFLLLWLKGIAQKYLTQNQKGKF
jgi:hypothetical protein